jgi:hypothetical protein
MSQQRAGTLQPKQKAKYFRPYPALHTFSSGSQKLLPSSSLISVYFYILFSSWICMEQKINQFIVCIFSA